MLDKAKAGLRPSILLRLVFPCCIFVSYFLYSVKTTGYKPLTTDPGDGDFELASRQSYGFFYDISSTKWNLLRKIYREHINHRDPQRPLLYSPHDPLNSQKWFSTEPAWYQNNYEPNFSCMHEKRVGLQMNGDGPKWVCDPHRIPKLALERKAKDPDHPGCVVYSVGSNGDFNFEMGFQKEVGEGVCEYHIFDPGNFAHKMPKELKRGHYHQWGLKKQDANSTPNADERYQGLHDIIKLLGHEHLDTIDIFKIDCEKCEWKTYMDWVADGIPMLHQIQVEVHGVPADAPQFYDSLELAGYMRYHKEPNIQFNPGCIEYGMVKVDTKFMEGKRLP